MFLIYECAHLLSTCSYPRPNTPRLRYIETYPVHNCTYTLRQTMVSYHKNPISHCRHFPSFTNNYAFPLNPVT